MKPTWSELHGKRKPPTGRKLYGKMKPPACRKLHGKMKPPTWRKLYGKIKPPTWRNSRAISTILGLQEEEEEEEEDVKGSFRGEEDSPRDPSMLEFFPNFKYEYKQALTSEKHHAGIGWFRKEARTESSQNLGELVGCSPGAIQDLPNMSLELYPLVKGCHLLIARSKAPPKHVDLKYWRPSEHLVNITCFASAVAPKPAFTLYTQAPDGNRTEVTVREGRADEIDGLYWAGAWGLIVWADTPPESVIGCTMRLPGTPHVHTRNKVYHPDLPIITTTTTTTTTTQPTTTEANRHPGPASDMSQSVPNATNKFFDFSGLFGSTSGGNAVRASAIFNFSLVWFARVMNMFPAYL
ncbi:uncharacterized protein [Palaemon carinicauda]|uniref:uncharacterized protein n=1 Tax=Palaemon carinicauda TaxID=392227 RepID=UPI0035B653C5